MRCSQNSEEDLAFPDEDFCVYKDFPFDKLVILMQICNSDELTELIKTEEFTCTYLWLIQYMDSYYEYFNKNIPESRYIKKLINSKEFKQKSKCNFERRLNLCNKTNYQIRDIWSTIDNYYLNKKLQIAFKISSYFFSFLGILTNALTIIL